MATHITVSSNVCAHALPTHCFPPRFTAMHRLCSLIESINQNSIANQFVGTLACVSKCNWKNFENLTEFRNCRLAFKSCFSLEPPSSSLSSSSRITMSDLEITIYFLLLLYFLFIRQYVMNYSSKIEFQCELMIISQKQKWTNRAPKRDADIKIRIKDRLCFCSTQFNSGMFAWALFSCQCSDCLHRPDFLILCMRGIARPIPLLIRKYLSFGPISHNCAES